MAKGFLIGVYPCRGGLGGQLSCSKGGMGGIGSPKWPDAIMVPFEKYTAIMPRGGNIHKIWGFIHLSVSIIRGWG